MFRKIVATALFSASFALVAPGAALADGRADFEARCDRNGGTIVNGECHYRDGSVETCSFGETDWACYRSNPTPTPGLFSKFKDIPRIIKTKPVHPGPGPVEMGSSQTKMKLAAPAQKSIRRFDAPVATREERAEKSIKLFDAPVMKMETIAVSPVLKMKSFN